MTVYSGWQIQTPSAFSPYNLKQRSCPLQVHIRLRGFAAHRSHVYPDMAHPYSYDAHCGSGLDTEGEEPLGANNESDTVCRL